METKLVLVCALCAQIPRRRDAEVPCPPHVGEWILWHDKYVEVSNSKSYLVEDPRYVNHSCRESLRNNQNTYGGRFYTLSKDEVPWLCNCILRTYWNILIFSHSLDILLKTTIVIHVYINMESLSYQIHVALVRVISLHMKGRNKWQIYILLGSIPSSYHSLLIKTDCFVTPSLHSCFLYYYICISLAPPHNF